MNPRYIVEPPASVKDTKTNTIWYTCDDPKLAQAVADSFNRVQAARATGCALVCGAGPGSANCLKCWSVSLNVKGVLTHARPS